MEARKEKKLLELTKVCGFIHKQEKHSRYQSIDRSIKIHEGVLI